MLLTGALFSWGDMVGTPEHTEHLNVMIAACFSDSIKCAAFAYAVADAFQYHELAHDQPWPTKFAKIGRAHV